MAQSSTRDRAASKPGAVQSKSRHGFFRFVGNAVAAYTLACGSVRDRCAPLEGQMDSQGLALYLQASSRHLPAAGARVDVWWRGRPRGGWSSALAGRHRAATQTPAEPATRGRATTPGQTVNLVCSQCGGRLSRRLGGAGRLPDGRPTTLDDLRIAGRPLVLVSDPSRLRCTTDPGGP